MPKKQQNFDSLEKLHKMANQEAKMAGMEFFGNPPNFFKAHEYESILLQHIKSDVQSPSLTKNKHQEFNKYINFLIKDLLRKHSSSALFIASVKKNKHDYVSSVREAEQAILNLTQTLEKINKINEKLNKTLDTSANKPVLTELSIEDYKQIYNFKDKVESVEKSMFYRNRAYKDKHYKVTDSGIKKSYYAPYSVTRSAKWAMLELIPELTFSFIGGIVTLWIAGTFSWPALLGGVAIGAALGAPLSLAFHVIVHEYQNSFRREFGRTLGDEIKDDLCNKILANNPNINRTQQRQIEKKVIEISKGVVGELYDNIAGAIAEDALFYYLLYPTRILTDSFAKKDKKIDFNKIKYAPLHLLSQVVAERIFNRIDFSEYIQNDTIGKIELSGELKDSVASNIRSALADFKAAEKNLDILRYEIKKEFAEPTTHRWRRTITHHPQHLESFVEKTQKLDTSDISPSNSRN